MRQGARVCYLQKLGLNGGTFCELLGCLFVGAVECCQAAVDPLVDLGVFDACGLHKGAYLADCCEQIGFGTRELDLDAVVGGHAAVFAHVVEHADLAAKTPRQMMPILALTERGGAAIG